MTEKGNVTAGKITVWNTVEKSVLLPRAGLQGGNQTMRTLWIRWGGMEKEQEHSGNY